MIIIGINIFFVKISGSSWKDNNFVYASINNTLTAAVNKMDSTYEAAIPSDILSRVNNDESINTGKILVSNGGKEKKNVLMIVLEGIPGAYFADVQKSLNVKHPLQLESLNKLRDNSLVVPNFIAHNNQTIRGLYSLLSGDYPKLDASTPKAYEYMQIQSNRNQMLPQLLKQEGYETAFIQAAPLEFMSKDQFMKQAGFDTIIGSEGFTKSYVPFGWGIDDKAFFEQVEDYLLNMDKADKPWFTTLLTVGTHHPFAVPKEYEDKYPNRKDAAVKYLDESLANFFEFLDHSGIGKDTLVLIVSDESHGVDNQPYGSNWGTSIAYSSDIKNNIINEGVYGQKDILASILDYVNPEKYKKNIGRSIFREYSTDEPILFGSHYNGDIFYSTNKGKVLHVDNKGDTYELVSENGQMFSSEYSKVTVDNNNIKNELLLYKQYVSRPLSDNLGRINIISEKEFQFTGNKRAIITDGQYVSLPENTFVTVELDYEVSNLKSGDLVTIELDNNDNVIHNKVIDSNNPKGEITHSFYNEKKQAGYSFRMFISSEFNSQTDRKEIQINNLSISFSKEAPSIDKKSVFNSYEKDKLYLAKNLIPLMFVTPNTYKTSNNSIISSKENIGIINVFGPYQRYLKGSYILEYKLKMKSNSINQTDDIFELDVISNNKQKVLSFKKHKLKDLKHDGSYYYAQLPFDVVDEADILELRLKKLASLDMEISEISTKKVE
ncbi:LTA synthase family protein [Paenibacillus sp. 481]|uniref:LTA synthase family protein n=1 Tax=Paenibacillus sp. 481 TaxID=2835869 RepID=UPI001E451D66|nr:LTA synthase family protein [Paenibacillus sp. 481]UHA71657.1 LTA synthase family protein [Paenibacillus sp. 481]